MEEILDYSKRLSVSYVITFESLNEYRSFCLEISDDASTLQISEAAKSIKTDSLIKSHSRLMDLLQVRSTYRVAKCLKPIRQCRNN